MFFTLFGAVALVGVVGVATSTLMRGPVGTVVKLNQTAKADAQMQIAHKLAMLEAAQQPSSGDCDADGFVEPLAPDTTCATKPGGGGCIPNAIGASKTDPWGTTYGYCAWDHGPTIGTCPGTVAGVRDGVNFSSATVIAIISAGPDRTFNTVCQDQPNYVVKQGGSDDLVLDITYAGAVQASGGLWALKQNDPNTAYIEKDIEAEQGRFSSGGRFSGGVDQTPVSFDNTRLEFGANSLLLLPDEGSSGTCNAANQGALRRNTLGGTQEAIEVCDFINESDWFPVGGSGSVAGAQGGLGAIQLSDGAGGFAADGSFSFSSGTGILQVPKVTASSDVSVGGDLTVTGNTDLNGTLDAGASTLGNTTTGTLGAGNTSITGTLGVTGTSTLAAVAAQGTTVTTLGATGAVDFDTTLNVDGATTLKSTLTVDGDINDSNGAVTIADADGLDVTGDVLGNAFRLKQGGGDEGLYYLGSGNGIELRTQGNSRLEIDEDGDIYIPGDVGIGVSDPQTMLDVADAIKVGMRNICDMALIGAIRYNSATDELEVCSKDAGGVGIPDWATVGTSAGGGSTVNQVWIDDNGYIRYESTSFIVDAGVNLNFSSALQGAGTRLLWYPDMKALRAGSVTADQWDENNTGANSTAFGLDTIAGGTTSFAAGDRAQATTEDAVAIGSQVEARATQSIALGNEALVAAGAINSMALGLGNPAGAIPQITGANSLGIFMGDQSGLTLSAANTMLLAGGKLVIDPNATATSLAVSLPHLAVDVEGAVGATQFCDKNGLFCFTASDVSGGAIGAPGADREVIYNSGGVLGTNASFVFTSAGRLGVGTNAPVSPAHIRGSTPNTTGILTLQQMQYGGDLLTMYNSAGTLIFDFNTAGVNDHGMLQINNHFGTPRIRLDAQEGAVGVAINADSFSVGEQRLELDVEGDIGGVNYCDNLGNDCFTAAQIELLSAGANAPGNNREIIFNSNGTFHATTNFVLTNNDLLGVGTASPGSRAHFASPASSATVTIEGAPNNESIVGLVTKGNYAEAVGIGATQGWTLYGVNDTHGSVNARNDFGISYYSAGFWIEPISIEHSNGNVGIGSFGNGTPDRSADAQLEISLGGGTADAFMISSDHDNDGDLLIMNSAGRLGIGTSNPSHRLHVNGDGMLVSFEGAVQYDAYAAHFYGNSAIPHFNGARGRGTSSLPAYVQNGDALSVFRGTGFGHSFGADMAMTATENHSATNGGTNLQFNTTPNGTGGVTPSTLRMVIGHDGTVSFVSTGALVMNRGTTLERPVAAENGMIRYNTQSNKFEAYQGGLWQDILTSAVAGGAGAPDRGVQFNSGGSFTADAGLLYTATGNLVFASSATQKGILFTSGAATIEGFSGVEANGRYKLHANMNASQGGGISFTATGGSSAGISAGAANGDLAFYTGGLGSERMRLTSAGRLGLGTATPSTLFYVSGSTTDGNHLATIRNNGTSGEFLEAINPLGNQVFSLRQRNDGASYLAMGTSNSTSNFIVDAGGDSMVLFASSSTTDGNYLMKLDNRGDSGEFVQMNNDLGNMVFSMGQKNDGSSYFTMHEGGGGGTITMDGQANPWMRINGNSQITGGAQDLELAVTGDAGAVNYCDQLGNNCFTAAQVAAGSTNAPGSDTQVIYNSGGKFFASAGFVYNSSGNLGVGINPPAFTNGVPGYIVAQNALVTFDDLLITSDDHSLEWGDDSTRITGNATSDFMTFFTNDVERMRLTSTGKLAFGVSAGENGILLTPNVATVEGFAGLETNPRYRLETNMGAAAGGGISFSFSGGERSGVAAGGVNGDLAFYTDGIGPTDEKMRLTSAGRLGLGNSTPAFLLDVGDAQMRMTLNNNVAGAADPYNLGMSSTNATRRYTLSTEDGAWRHAIQFGDGGASPNETVFGIARSSNSGASWSPSFVVKTDTGYVGIGTNAPQASLDVAGTGAILFPRGQTGNRPAGIDGMIRYNSVSGKFEGHQGGNWFDIITSAVGGGAAAPDRGIQFNSGGQFAADANFTFTSVSRLGVGTAAPQKKLHVVVDAMVTPEINGTAQMVLEHDAGAYMSLVSPLGRGIWFDDADAAQDGYILYNDPALPEGLIFGTNAASRMYIDSLGQVGVGTSTPGSLLFVSGGDLTVIGNNTGSASVPVSGAGTRMFFDVDSGAFRAGRVLGTQWDNANVGSYSAAFGISSRAAGASSFAAGEAATADGAQSVAMGDETEAKGIASVALGRKAIVANTGQQSMAFGLGDPAGIRPQVSGTNALGIFINDQSGVNFASAGTMGLFGGQMIIDPKIPATNLAADTALEVDGSLKIAYGGEACDANREGGLYYNSADDKFYGCKTAGSWTELGSGAGGGTPAGSDRQLQFNSGGTFGAATNLVYTSAGRFGIGTATPQGNTLTLREDVSGNYARTLRLENLQNAANSDPSIGWYSLNASGGTVETANLSSIIGNRTAGSETSGMVFQALENGTFVRRMALDQQGDLVIGGNQLSANNMLSVIGEMSIGPNYDTVNAPTNGLIVEGNTGIKTSAPSEALDVAGNIKVSNAVKFGLTSGAAAPVSSALGADAVLESHLKAVNSPTDEYCLTYETTTGDFEWQTCGGGGASALSGLTGGTANNYINSTNFQQGWSWSTLNTQTALQLGANAITSGKILYASSTATGFTGTMIEALLSGDNAANTGTLVKSTVSGASSAAVPMMVTNAGTGISFRVNDDGTDTDSTPFVVSNAGSVGINMSNPSVALDVTGDIEYTGTITDVSDIRLKKDITPLNAKDVIGRLSQVDTYSFRMINDEKGQLELGVMAQEVEKVFPELVRTSADEMGTKSVNYVGFIAPLIEASKELKAENDSLRAEIAEMKAAQADILQEVKGLKAHTGYGISKAEIGLWMIAVIFGMGSVCFLFGVILRNRQRKSG